MLSDTRVRVRVDRLREADRHDLRRGDDHAAIGGARLRLVYRISGTPFFRAWPGSVLTAPGGYGRFVTFDTARRVALRVTAPTQGPYGFATSSMVGVAAQG